MGDCNFGLYAICTGCVPHCDETDARTRRVLMSLVRFLHGSRVSTAFDRIDAFLSSKCTTGKLKSAATKCCGARANPSHLRRAAATYRARSTLTFCPVPDAILIRVLLSVLYLPKGRIKRWCRRHCPPFAEAVRGNPSQSGVPYVTTPLPRKATYTHLHHQYGWTPCEHSVRFLASSRTFRRAQHSCAVGGKRCSAHGVTCNFRPRQTVRNNKIRLSPRGEEPPLT